MIQASSIDTVNFLTWRGGWAQFDGSYNGLQVLGDLVSASYSSRLNIVLFTTHQNRIELENSICLATSNLSDCR
jgi:hypothetical protein